MNYNWMAVLVSALVPFALGYLWYGPLFGKAWMTAAGMTEEKARSGNMAKIFGLSFLLNLLFAFNLYFLVVHQSHLSSLFFDAAYGGVNPDTADGKMYAEVMAAMGDRYRGWTHGVVHGILEGIFFVLPVVGVISLYERKSFKYVAINAGYWIVLLAITGAIICGWQ